MVGDVDVHAVTSSDYGDGGIANGSVLSRFAEQVHTDTDLDAARAAVIEVVGDAGLVDAAAICANFNMMVRIADGTGTPLDRPTVVVSGELRDELKLDELASQRMASVDGR